MPFTADSQLEKQMQVADHALRNNMSLEQARYAERMHRASIRQDNAYRYYEQKLPHHSKKE